MKDLVIIGSGPGGYVAAIRAAQLGLDTAIVEKENLGGVCLNKGCIPTKALLHSTEIIESIEEASASGITVSGYEVDVKKIINRKDNIVKKLTSGIGFLLQNNKVEIIKGQADIKDKNTVTVGNQEIKTQNIIIATGSEVAMPPIPGSDNDLVMVSDDALKLDTSIKSIAVIGGGVIGLEFATYFNSLNTEVHVVEMLDRILPPADKDISSELEATIKKKGIKVYTKAKVKEIIKDGIIIEKDGKENTINVDKVLVCAGRVPDTGSIDCNKLGIKMDRKSIIVNEKGQTSISNIYAIGDVTGGILLAHKASYEGERAVEHIAGKKLSKYSQVIPSCVFSSPEVAFIGLTEQECILNKIEYSVGNFPYDANGKCLAEGAKGFVKVITDKRYGEILGVHIMGKHACELIMQAAIAIANELTVDELIHTIHPHPSVTETIHEAYLASLERAIHIPN